MRVPYVRHPARGRAYCMSHGAPITKAHLRWLLSGGTAPRPAYRDGISNAELDRLVELQPDASDPKYKCGQCGEWFRMPFGAEPPFHCTRCGDRIREIVRNWQ